MSVQFPDWYEGGWPDRELVVLDLAQRWLDLLNPPGLAVTWLPDDLNELLDAGCVVVRVYRGGLGADGLIDAAAVQLGVIGQTRADSWAVVEYLRQMLLSYEHGGEVRHEDGSVSYVSFVEEMIGPQQLPELNPDHRLVPVTFRVECRLPRGIPDYARIRESLPL
ncbi:phage tail termination protein [Nocardia amamiensis]|uniref:phage tail termination protein n=1 Tax=Nocardia amamiensis TaxID=404578 RepID=UPI003F8156EF